MEEIRVFVYGTLKPGEVGYDRYCAHQDVVVREAIAPGQLYHLPFGYPAMTPGTTSVYGFLLTFTEPTLLQAMDEYEGYDPSQSAGENEYYRDWIEIFDLKGTSLGQAWVYRMSCEQAIQQGGRLVPSGNWSLSSL